MYHSFCFPRLNQCRIPTGIRSGLPVCLLWVFLTYKFHIRNIQMLFSLVKNKIRLFFNVKTFRQNMSSSTSGVDGFFALVDYNNDLEKFRSRSVCSDLRSIPELPGTKLQFSEVTNAHANNHQPHWVNQPGKSNFWVSFALLCVVPYLT